MKEPVWIRLDVVLAMHEEALMLHGGPEGVRDLGLLESALARPKNLFVYGEQEDVSMAMFAAAYAKGIVANHPFVDGNKRTAFTVSVTFLEVERSRIDRDERGPSSHLLESGGGRDLGGAARAVVRAQHDGPLITRSNYEFNSGVKGSPASLCIESLFRLGFMETLRSASRIKGFRRTGIHRMLRQCHLPHNC